jgi:hypothetical protein
MAGRVHRIPQRPAPRAPLTPDGKDAAWSGFADSWRLLAIADHTERMWPGISSGAFAAVCLLTVPGIPLLGVFGYLLAGGHGAELGVLAGVAADVTIATKAAARWSHLAWFAEFDGLVLRQWQTGNEKSDDGIQYFVAIDDGTSAQAWAFPVEGGVFGKLPPGTLVHVQVNPRLNKLLDMKPLRRMPAAPALADAMDPRRPARPGFTGPG